MNKNTPLNSVASRLTIDSKSMLAKLMAVENITVEHQASAKTAYFDTRSRRLVLPVWEGISDRMHDMLIAHEVGHALYTPGEAVVKQAVDYVDPKNPDVVKSYLNVLEDARVERFVKAKYPGTVHDFREAYKELYDKNAFNVKGVQNLPLIDKLNLKAKVGSHADFDFPLTPEEQVFFDDMQKTQTYDDCVKLAQRIYQYEKPAIQPQMAPPPKQKKPGQGPGKGQKGQGQGQGQGSGKGSGETEDTPNKGSTRKIGDSPNDDSLETEDDVNSQNGKDGEDESDSEGQDGEDSESENESKDQSDKDSDAKGEKESDSKDAKDSKDDGKPKDAPKPDNKGQESKGAAKPEEKTKPKNHPPASISDGAYTQMVNGIQKNGSPTVYLNIPRKINLENIIVDYKVVIDDLKDISTQAGAAYLDEIHNKFKTDSRNYIQMMANEFTRKQAADAHMRTRIAESGSINPNRLHAYKFTEDVFKKIQTVQNGKNHGIVMVIDWSGSMGSCLFETVMQLLNLTYFCKKVNIPFDVYAFSDHYREGNGKPMQDAMKGDATINYVRLLNLLSSRMNMHDFTAGSKNLLHMAYCHRPDMQNSLTNKAKSNTFNGNYSLGGTPLNASILALFKLVPDFQKRHKVQIVNTVILTDGEDSYGYNSGTMVFRDMKTRSQVAFDNSDRNANSTSALLKLLRFSTGSNLVGFYLIPESSGRQVLGSLLKLEGNGSEIKGKLDKACADFRLNKFANAPGWGYDKYFILPSDKLGTALDDKLDYVKQTLSKNQLGKTFTANLTASKVNRVVLTQFIDIIAKEAKGTSKNDGARMM